MLRSRNWSFCSMLKSNSCPLGTLLGQFFWLCAGVCDFYALHCLVCKLCTTYEPGFMQWLSQVSSLLSVGLVSHELRLVAVTLEEIAHHAYCQSVGGKCFQFRHPFWQRLVGLVQPAPFQCRKKSANSLAIITWQGPTPVVVWGVAL